MKLYYSFKNPKNINQIIDFVFKGDQSLEKLFLPWTSPDGLFFGPSAMFKSIDLTSSIGIDVFIELGSSELSRMLNICIHLGATSRIEIPIAIGKAFDTLSVDHRHDKCKAKFQEMMELLSALHTKELLSSDVDDTLNKCGKKHI